MVSRDILQGQKVLGWVLILTGLLLLILIGLARSLQARFPLPVLGTFGSLDPTMVGAVAWLLLAGGYVFVLSARLEERLRDIGGELEERICHLTRELAALQQRIGDRCGADHPEGATGAARSPVADR
jgi:thiosulfate reductase cytochrome b subunit